MPIEHTPFVTAGMEFIKSGSAFLGKETYKSHMEKLIEVETDNETNRDSIIDMDNTEHSGSNGMSAWFPAWDVVKEVDPNGVGQHEMGSKLDAGKPDLSSIILRTSTP